MSAAAVPLGYADPTAGMRPINSRWLHANMPCRAACPVGTNAGAYAALIAEGHFEEAYALARRPNPFASICGRICAHPCEAACRRGAIDNPIAIRALKRFVCDRHGVESGRSFADIERLVERPRPRLQGGKVAVVGAGPAGLTCAHDLALMGHQVVVFDAAPVAGGMMRLAIPEYRLPRSLIDREIAFIAHLGVEIRLGVEIGRDLRFADLTRDFGAVFLAPGCRRAKIPALPGMELEGAVTAVDFLVAQNLDKPLRLGREVVVVGGGNVAFDVARTARRFGGTSRPDEPHHNLMLDATLLAARTAGTRVTMVCLESLEEMPADIDEIEEGRREGVSVIHRRGPKTVLGEAGKVRGLQTLDVVRVFDADGRFAPVFAPGTEKVIPCDSVIFAIGQIADLSFLGDGHGLTTTPQQAIEVDRATLATSRPGVFAGGDVAFGPRIVIEAVADGRKAALQIDTYLTGRQSAPAPVTLKIFDTFGFSHPFAAGDYEHLDRALPPTIPVIRRAGRTEVETSYRQADARQEGSRCLHCWVNTVFDSRRMSGSECIQCGGCADICPVECIDLVSLRRVGGADNVKDVLRTADGEPLAALVDVGAALIKDETACIRCGLCARRCPVGCISMQGFYVPAEAGMVALCERSL